MATIKSNLVTAAENRLPSDGIRNGDDFSGKLTLATATVTLPSTLAANDILTIIPEKLLPLGACVVPQLCSVTSADPGTTLTLDIGYAANPDAYADGIVLSAGGIVNFCSALPVPAAVAAPVRLDADGAIFATVASASTITDGTVLTFTIAYRSK